MSTPEGHKKLWKNCNWENDEEKLAFFNHYFKNSSIVSNHVKITIDGIKENLIGFIAEEKIKVGGKERPITLKDLLEQIKQL